MGAINTGSFAKALWPGINKWYGETYKEWVEEYSDLFSSERSTKAYEEEVGISGFGLAQEKSEGAGVAYDESKQAFIDRYTNKTYALGFIITKEAMEDNQYDISALGRNKARALAFSMRQTMEIIAANVYNRAFSDSYTFGDGKELCADDHPLFAGGTFANELAVAADLSEASLEQACIDIAGFVNDRGLKIAVMPETLHIPKELAFEAERILRSTLQNDTANNAVNALRSMGMFKGGAKVNHYFTDPDAWFIRTNCPDGMKCFKRVDTEFGMDNDFDTDNAKFKARFRVSFGATDKRGIFGSPGA
jgi:phage major head subunit gpT-like protein